MSKYEDRAAAMARTRDNPFERQLPANIEAEQALLGSLLVNNAAYHAILPTGIEAKHFYEPIHRTIFEAAKSCITSNKIANPVTIRSFIAPDILNKPIGDMTVGGYTARLCSEATSIVNAPDYAGAVIFYAHRRDVLPAADIIDTAACNAQDELAFVDQIRDARDRLTNTINAIEGQGAQDDDQIVDAYLQMITGENEATGADGIPLPFPDFEYLINDNMLRPGRTYGILGASAEGKTSLTLQVVYAALIAGHPVCILSFDQDQMEILAQITAQQEGIPFSSQIQNSRNHQRLSQHQIDQAYGFIRKLKRRPFEIIQCRTSDTVQKLETKMDGFLRRRTNGKMPLFVFDHIRAIKPAAQADEGTKALQIGQDIHDAMKARRSAGWVLQQRSTTGLKRENPRPASADLFGGDSAKQPFDVIFYVFRASEHRDEQVRTAKEEKDVAGIKERFNRIYGRDRNDEYIPIENCVELGLIKNRFGPKNRRAHLAFDPDYTRFSSRRQQDQWELLP
jgi:replicative DNA helicase